MVCANCHVNYYFAGDGKLLTIPWDKGTTVDAVEASYQASGFADWTHPDSGTPMIKIRHPRLRAVYLRGDAFRGRGFLRRLPHALPARRGSQVLLA